MDLLFKFWLHSIIVLTVVFFVTGLMLKMFISYLENKEKIEGN